MEDMTNQSEVSVSVSEDGPGALMIVVAGELDLASVGSVQAGMESHLANGPQEVTFDLGNLTFMDSSGIALLVQTANIVPRVIIVNAPPIVRRVLEATGLLEVFGIVP